MLQLSLLPHKNLVRVIRESGSVLEALWGGDKKKTFNDATGNETWAVKLAACHFNDWRFMASGTVPTRQIHKTWYNSHPCNPAPSVPGQCQTREFFKSWKVSKFWYQHLTQTFFK